MWVDITTILGLTALELVLGIDNILMISLLVAHIPQEQRQNVRLLGLTFALVARILMVIGAVYLAQMVDPIVLIFSLRDLLFLFGGAFLLYKSTEEILYIFRPKDIAVKTVSPKKSILVLQIIAMDMVFALDSVLTAIAVTENTWIIIVAVILSFIIVMIFAGAISDFIWRNKYIKVIALGFLFAIGIALVTAAFHFTFNKSILYALVGIALVIEFGRLAWLRWKRHAT